MNCALIDNSSLADILSLSAYEKLGVEEVYLKSTFGPLVGFAGETNAPMGPVLLPVILGTRPRVLNTMVTFLVIDPPKKALAYNAIIGRTTLCTMQVATSVYYLKMKFLTLFDTWEVWDDQKQARSCYNVMVCIYLLLVKTFVIQFVTAKQYVYFLRKLWNVI